MVQLVPTGGRNSLDGMKRVLVKKTDHLASLATLSRHLGRNPAPRVTRRASDAPPLTEYRHPWHLGQPRGHLFRLRQRKDFPTKSHPACQSWHTRGLLEGRTEELPQRATRAPIAQLARGGGGISVLTPMKQSCLRLLISRPEQHSYAAGED
ncbi:hypothetical protein LX36DRAFT_144244 [Colletotrichum falcatum]|nr:hypothetical protein LX36DRAFT_144244 [Colletotrichum falcatum]